MMRTSKPEAIAAGAKKELSFASLELSGTLPRAFTHGRVRFDAAEMLKALRPEIKALLNDLKSGLHGVKDPQTGLETKAMFLSMRGIKELNRAVPGSKVVYLLDFNGFSVLNKLGLGSIPDALVKRINKLFERAIKEGSHETSSGTKVIPKAKLVRIGGDEFALVIQDNDQGRVVMRSFAKRLEAARESLLRGKKYREKVAEMRESKIYSKSKIADPIQYVATANTMMRMLRNSYQNSLPKGKPFRLQDFRKYLGEHFLDLKLERLMSRHGLARPFRLSGRRALTGQQQLNAVRINLGDGQNRTVSLGGVTFSGVRMGNRAFMTNYLKAIGQCAKMNHDFKRKGETDHDTQLRAADADPAIVLKTASREEIRNFGRSERAVKRLVSHFNKGVATPGDAINLFQSCMCDPNLVHVLRDSRVGGKSAKLALLITAPTRFTHIKVLFDNFAAINNSVTPEMADKFLREISELIFKHLPTATVVRKGGGDLHIFVEGKVDTGDYIRLTKALQSKFEELKNNPWWERVLAEIYERNNLKRLIPQMETERIEHKPRLRIAKSERVIEPDSLMSDQISA